MINSPAVANILCTVLLVCLDLFPYSPSVTPGSTLHMICQINSNKCDGTSMDLQFVFKFRNNTKIPIVESYIKVINTTAVELSYPNIQLHFNKVDITCQHRRKYCRSVTDWVYVGCKCLSAFLLHVLFCCL